MLKVAIIGAGFSGLGLCYHLLQQGCEVTLFDPKDIGTGVSGMASGLLHPYPGESARLSWQGKVALKEAIDLIDLASCALGKRVARADGILRFALNGKQEKAFKERAEVEEDVRWLEAEACQFRVGGVNHCPGIFISSGWTVHATLYLKGLWKVCQQLGAHFEKRAVTVFDLDGFDQVVIAAGDGVRHFKECEELNFRYNKGQLLVCKKPSDFNPSFSLIGKGYVALSERNDECYVGSTYEHHFLDGSACMEVAKKEIFSRVRQFLPTCVLFGVKKCLAGIRVSCRKTYIPCARKLRDGLWVLTGMGSRGLLYHGLMGRYLASALFSEDERLIPEEACV